MKTTRTIKGIEWTCHLLDGGALRCLAEVPLRQRHKVEGAVKLAQIKGWVAGLGVFPTGIIAKIEIPAGASL